MKLTDAPSKSRRPFSAGRIRVVFALQLIAGLLVLAWPGAEARAQARYRTGYQEPEWFTFRLSEVSAGVYAEGTFDRTSFTKSGVSATHEHFFVGPSLGFNAEGSIYHPNLARYFISTEGAYGYAHDSFTGASSRNEWEYLGHFSANVDLLENKPYHGSFFVNSDHTFRDNDFFSRVTVDSLRYGARANWHFGNWTLSADYLHRDEDSTSPFPVTQVTVTTNIVNGTNVVTLKTNKHNFDQVVTSKENTATFGARHERGLGATDFNYSWNQYTRLDAGRVGEGNDHSFSLADSEHFGPHDRYRLNANLGYLLRDSMVETSDELQGNLNFSIEHRPNLNSYYDVSYDHFETDFFNSDSYLGQVFLRHQLYESLTSTLTLRGADYESSAQNNTGYTRRYGGGFSEDYVKQVGISSRLRIDNSVYVDHTDQKNTGTAKNERHSFTEGGPVPDSFFLNLPDVLQFTIIVTDVNNSQPPLLRDFDYRVTQFGSRTVIERLHPGVPNNVLVDYQSQPTPPGSYETVSDGFQIRYELWKNLLGVYARVNLSVNNAPAELRVQSVRSYTFGSDLTWRWLRAGAEYEIYDSTESDYESVRMFQSVAFHPDEVSTLSLDSTETWIDYKTAHRSEFDYQFISRYHRPLTRRLRFDVDAGISVRRGAGVDQILAAVRPSIRYVIGKMTIDAGYDYEYELFLNSEEREKHMFFIRARRVF